MSAQKRRRLIEAIESARKSKVICYLTSDRENAQAFVSKDVMPVFFEHLEAGAQRKKVDVFLFTVGGDILAAFGLARLVREYASTVGTLVAQKAHSAGTLFALGSNEIVMTRLATLSPIDPSWQGLLNPVVDKGGEKQFVKLSVESMAGFRSLLTEQWGLSGQEALSVAFRMLAERVHPLVLGDLFRLRRQIERLALTLLRLHRKNDSAVHSMVETLTKKLWSHDYLISRTEAREMFGPQVAPEDRALEKLLWELHLSFAEEMQLGIPYEQKNIHRAERKAGRGQGVKYVLRQSMVESLTSSDVYELDVRLHKAPRRAGAVSRGNAGPQIVEEIVGRGWKKYRHR
jgi:hypothetical protein